jgi:hypothetical protein
MPSRLPIAQDLELLCQAAAIAAGQPFLSQRELRWRLRIGAVRARRLHEALEDHGVVEPAPILGERGHWCPRATLITRADLPAKLAELRAAAAAETAGADR